MQPVLGQQMPLAGRAMWRPAMRRPFHVGQNAVEGIGVGAVMAPVIGLGISGAVAYVGMRAALTQKGWNSALGWVAGISGILGALSTLAWMIGFGSIPEAQLPQNGAPATAQQQVTV